MFENPWSAVGNPTSALGPSGSSFGPSSLPPIGIHHLLLSNLTTGYTFVPYKNLSVTKVLVIVRYQHRIEVGAIDAAALGPFKK